MYAAVATSSATTETAETAMSATVAHSVVATTFWDAFWTSWSVDFALSRVSPAFRRMFTSKRYSFEP